MTHPRTPAAAGRAVLAAAALTAGLLGGCGGTTAELDPGTTAIELGFTDSSVPPEYHRSFVLTVTDGVGVLVVTSYDEELQRVEADIAQTVVDDLVAAYNAGDLEPVLTETDDADGCAGGTTLRLQLADDTHAVEQVVPRCGGADEEAAAALQDAVAPLLAPFDVERLTEGRYP